MRGVLVPVLLLCAACTASRPALRASRLVGTEAQVVAPDLQGREVRVLDGRRRVRVVDFFASWCDPCREQMPVLDALAQRFGPDGLSVYAVSFDEDRAMLEAFVAEVPVGFPVLWDKGGAKLADPFEVTRLPTTIVVDRRGIVRHVHLGFEPSSPERLEREVQRLLAEAIEDP